MALECAVNAANPPPIIKWLESRPFFNSTTLSTSVIDTVQDGRYLYFGNVRHQDIVNSTFTCAVINAFSNQFVTSGRLYTVTPDLADDELAVFILSNVTLVAKAGETLVLYNSAAYGTDNFVDQFNVRCRTERGKELAGTSTQSTYRVPDPPTENFITCSADVVGKFLFTIITYLVYVGESSIDPLNKYFKQNIGFSLLHHHRLLHLLFNYLLLLHFELAPPKVTKHTLC